MSTFSPDVPLPVSVTVAQPCIKCGYSLLGLRTDSRCPECGTPVDRSLRGDLLIYSDSTYVDSLRKGATLIMASILLMVLMTVGVVALGAIGVSPDMISLLGLVVSGCFLAGWWFLTSPDLGQLTANKGEKPRQIVRVCVGIAAVAKIITTVLPFIITIDTAVHMVLQLLDSLVLFVGFFAGMLYLRWLTPRIPNYNAYKRAKTLMIMISVVIGLYLITAVIGLLTYWSTTGGKPAGAAPAAGAALTAAVPTMVGGCAAAIMGLVTLIMYYNLFSWLRKDFKRVLEAASA